jgi:hypothetical protein
VKCKINVFLKEETFEIAKQIYMYAKGIKRKKTRYR